MKVKGAVIKKGGTINKMNKHECMKCRYYLTHFDDLIICVKHENLDDLQSLIVTVNRSDNVYNKCILFTPESGKIN